MITRDEWGAVPPAYKGNIISRNPLGVAVHWEGPKMGTFRHDQCAAKVRGIQHFHMVERGWADIAYNFVVCPHGEVFEGRGLDVGSGANGTDKANYDWYAVCAMLGNGDFQSPELYAGIRDAVAICRARAGKAITGHRDHFQTACPGDELYAKVQDGSLAPVETPKPPPPPAPLPKPLGLNVKSIDLRDVSPLVTGPGVKPMQRLLGVVADGLAGPGTRAALGAAQKRADLPVDYIFGPATASALLAGK